MDHRADPTNIIPERPIVFVKHELKDAWKFSGPALMSTIPQTRGLEQGNIIAIWWKDLFKIHQIIDNISYLSDPTWRDYPWDIDGLHTEVLSDLSTARSATLLLLSFNSDDIERYQQKNSTPEISVWQRYITRFFGFISICEIVSIDWDTLQIKASLFGGQTFEESIRKSLFLESAYPLDFLDQELQTLNRNSRDGIMRVLRDAEICEK